VMESDSDLMMQLSLPSRAAGSGPALHLEFEGPADDAADQTVTSDIIQQKASRLTQLRGLCNRESTFFHFS
jgi:hypothetical protein